MKELWKSVNICRSYGQLSTGFFYETPCINSTWKVPVSFKIIMTTSVTRSCFTTQHQQTSKTKITECKTKTKIKTHFWSQTGLILRPMVSDHITTILCRLSDASASNHFIIVAIERHENTRPIQGRTVINHQTKHVNWFVRVHLFIYLIIIYYLHKTLEWQTKQCTWTSGS